MPGAGLNISRSQQQLIELAQAQLALAAATAQAAVESAAVQKEMLVEMRKNNMHLSKITGLTPTGEEVQ